MMPDTPILVRLRVSDAPLGQRVAACLTAAGECVQLVVAADAAHPDVIVTDHSSDADTDIGRVLLSRGTSEGEDFDAVLSADFLDRELAALVRLVGQLSRLRRQLADRDVSHRTLRDQAHTDPVTGLANRRGWDEALEETLAQCRQRRIGLTIAVIDLDHYKRINDTAGHAAGDEVLRRAAAELAGSLREGDTVARLGGDEFAITLPGLTAEHAPGVVDRIRQSVSEVTLPDRAPEAEAQTAAGVPLLARPAVPESDHAQPLTASAGYTCATTEQLTANNDPNIATTLLAAADRAMYRAKEADRDCTRGGYWKH